MTNDKKPKASLTTITPAYSVLAYFESQTTTPSRRSYRVLLRRLDKFLGRPALLDDMNDQTLTAFFAFLGDASQQLKSSTRLAYQNYLLSIARHAADRGIIPHPMPDWGTRLTKDPTGDDRSYFNLLRYFEEVYVIERATDGEPLTPATQKSYRSAIRTFERYQPNHRRLNHITQQAVERFREWLLKCGMNQKKAGNHAFAVAAVAKHAMPSRFLQIVDEQEPALDVKRTLAYVFEQHYLPAKTKITSGKTEEKYQAVFNAFGRHLGRVPTLDDLTDENVGAYMRELRRAGKSAATVNGYRSKLLAMWNFCARKRLVEEFPTIDQMPVAAIVPRAWGRDELAALLIGCEHMPGNVAGVIPAPQWWRTLHLVAWDTGERTGALLALTWEMLNLQTGMLVVPAEFRKGGRKPMVYKLRPDTLREVTAFQQPERALIFPFNTKGYSFYQHYKRLLKFAGLPYVKYKSCIQKMRRSHATHIEAAGGNATEALSHSMRSITENSYLDPTMIQREQQNEKLFRIGGAG